MAIGEAIPIGVAQTEMELNIEHVSATTQHQQTAALAVSQHPTQQLQWSMEYYKKLTLGPVPKMSA